jgi:hypothetical protein
MGRIRLILDRTNPNRAAADPYARKILSIDLPLASSSTNLSGSESSASTDRGRMRIESCNGEEVLDRCTRGQMVTQR